MKLLIDFGNSRFKWARLDGQTLIDANACFYNSDDAIHRVQEACEQIGFDSIQEIHAVSVLGEAFEKEFIASTEKTTGITASFYYSQSANYGVTLAYDHPSSYGADRYAALIAAHHKTSGTKIIVDCGTATTIDVLDAKGKHLGGLIIPGITLMCTSLANKASGVRMPEKAGAARLFNDNTADSVFSGSALVLSHGVRGIVQEIMSTTEQVVTVYVTGGESDMISLEDIDYVNCPNLVLEGIQIMQG
tara:strand:- start:827 stop:1567 length:741 start_codon:yes stop_codon:yes gene_type:complete